MSDNISLQGYFGGGGTDDSGGFYGNDPVLPSSTPTNTPTTTITLTPTVTPTVSPTISDTPTQTPTISDTPTQTPSVSFTPTVTPTYFTNTPSPSITPSRTSRKIPATPPPPKPTETEPIDIDREPIDAPVLFATQTPTPTQTPTQTRTPTQTPTQTSTRTQTPTQTRTPSRTGTATPSGTVTQTPTKTQTPTSTITPSPTRTQTPTPTQTATNTPTQTRTPSNTPSNTPSRTAAETPTGTPTKTPTTTKTPTPTKSLSPTPSPTKSLSPTPSRTPPETPTKTPSLTPSPTITKTPSVTPSKTKTPSPSPSRYPTNDYGNVAWWRFDNNYYDSSCNAYDLYPNPNYITPVFVNGYFSGNKAASFNATSSAQRNLFDFPNCPKATIAGWVKIPSGAWSQIFYNTIILLRASGGDHINVGIDPEGYPYLLLGERSNKAVLLRGYDYNVPRINDGLWHSFCFQIDNTIPSATKFGMLIDNKGVQLDTNPVTVDVLGVSDTKDSSVYVGAYGFNGVIDELMVWDRILRPESITSVLQNPLQLISCPTQTPTPTKSLTPTGTPTPTRTTIPDSKPVIIKDGFTVPRTCTDANRPFCPGATIRVKVTNWGTRTGVTASSLTFYWIPLEYYNNQVPGLAYGTPAGTLARSSGLISFQYVGTTTNPIKTASWYVVAAINEYGVWSDPVFVLVPNYVYP